MRGTFTSCNRPVLGAKLRPRTLTALYVGRSACPTKPMRMATPSVPNGMRPAPPVRELALPFGSSGGERLGSAVSETSGVSNGRQYRRSEPLRGEAAWR